MIDKQKKAYQAMGEFVDGFVRDLSNLSDEGWSVLVEGPRDERALRALGYEGELVTVSELGRSMRAVVGRAKGVVILTDLDREGAVLAARFVRRIRHEGIQASLSERRRLKAASHGVFLHIENLSRFGRRES